MEGMDELTRGLFWRDSVRRGRRGTEGSDGGLECRRWRWEDSRYENRARGMNARLAAPSM